LTESTPARDEPVHPKPPTPVQARRPRWIATNLQLRLLTAALLIPLVTYVVFQGGYWVLATVMVITVLGLSEFYQLIEAKGAHPLRSFGTVAGASLPVVAFVGSEYHATILMSAVLLGVMVAQLGKARIADSLASISGTFFGVFYVGWLLSHAVVLRDFHRVVEGKWGEIAAAGILPEIGIFYLFFAIAIVIAGDAGAYFAGRAYGRHKLAPKISPAKTVEGAVGAVLAGIGVGLACKAVFEFLIPGVTLPLGWVVCGLLATILAVVGIIGDLVESLLKRDAAVKDTGVLLPGTGGILDRIDSSLLAIPVMYYLMLAYTYFWFG
jgi:phosphatidate cytidylyltransferase